MRTATTGDIFAALFAAHHVGDYWLQTSCQAMTKGTPDGRPACARHAATVTACKAAALTALHLSGHRVRPGPAVAALAADAVSHYWADRRTTLAGAASRLSRIGKDDFYRLGAPRENHDDNTCLGTGAHAMDQAFHITFLWAASVITARPDRHEPACG